MACFKPVTHVIFDLDGTIQNIVDVLTSLLDTTAKKYGKALTTSQRIRCFDESSLKTYQLILEELNLPISLAEFLQIVFTELNKPDEGGVKLQPGVKRLVKHFYDSKIPIAIATSSPKLFYDLTTRCLKDLKGCFHHSIIIPNEPEVKRDKPAPDVFLECARRFDENPPPEKILVIEDSPLGVQAAVAALMQVVMVPHPMKTVSCNDATVILKSLEDFQPEIFGLPPFPNE